MPSFKPEKLRVNLRLTINRLKLLEKKKSEFVLKGVAWSGFQWYSRYIVSRRWITPLG